MTEPAAPEFSPERATRYVADTLPSLLARAAAQLGEGPDPSPEPSARAARLALLSAREVLDQLGALVPEATLLPLESALARLEQRFRDRHPQLPLAMPNPADQPMTLADRVAAAWDAPESPPTAPAPAAPSPGLPARGAGLDL